MGFVECPMCRRAVVDDRDAVHRHVTGDHSFWQILQLLWRVEPAYLVRQAALVGLVVFGAMLMLAMVWQRAS